MMNRRSFFSKAAAGAAGLTLLKPGRTAAALPEPSGPADSKPKAAAPGPATRKLGKTGIELPIVSMGVMNSSNSDLVRKALESGIRHLDTAWAYGQGANESMIGAAVQDMKMRDKVVIATKEMVTWQRRGLSDDKARDMMIDMTEASLKRLRSDYIDILYLHDVSTVEEVRLPGVLEAFRILKQQGKVRFTGFSTHSQMAVCLEEAVRLGVHDVVLTAWNYALAGDEALRAALRKAAASGIGLVAMKTQCSQYWYSQSVPEDQRKFYDGKGMHPAMLKWAVREPSITTAVPGCTTFQQLEEDVAVGLDPEYTPAERKFLEDRKVRLTLGYCVQCRRCTGTCPNGADVPSLMRVHQYAARYNNFEAARRTLDGLAAGSGLDACVSCAGCSAACVRDVPVRERIGDLRTLLG
jgi:uncharacterized protein